MGSRLRLSLTVATAAVLFVITPMQEQVSAQSGSLPTVIISEFRFSGPLSATGATTPNNEFIELFNASASPVNIGGWTLQSSNNVVNNSPLVRATIPAGTIMNPGCFYLFGNSASGGYVGTGAASPDQTYSVGFADEGGAAIVNVSTALARPIDQSKVVDQVGFGVDSAFGEGARLTFIPATSQARSYERVADPVFGFRDENNNATDFAYGAPTPRNSSPANCVTLTEYLPHDIQGAGAVSPHAVGTPVLVRGVVTARKAGGFFIQTEDGLEDVDPNTSEGLFVSSSHGVTVGHLVKVVGKVNEAGSLTQVDNVSIVADLGAVSVAPASYELTSADLSADGALDQLEKFEGMIVTAPMLSAVSGTSADGAFYAVLTGQPRPFREPGVHASQPPLPCAVGPCNVPVFDGNPELLRVDSDGLLGASPIVVSTGAVLIGAVGPLDVVSGAYTLLPAPFVPAGGMSIVAAPAAAADQFTVASLNLGAPYAVRASKTSQAIRNVLNFPDVIGVQGVEDLAALTTLAGQIDADAAAASQPLPSYQAYVVESTAPGTTANGFLVKTAGDRVTNVSVEQFGEDVNDHPSLVLRAQVNGPSAPQSITVISNQFAALDDPADAAARARRQAQAEQLANYVQARQGVEAIVSLGDYNALPFNDGYVDVVGTVRGVPAPPDTVNLASPALVSPSLVDADASNPAAERYSSIGNGSARSLDHVLFSANLSSQFVGLAHVRLNADFADALRDLDTTPARLSDRDPLVAYFTFPRDVTPPQFDVTPQDVVVEALSANGAVATFTTPSAHDDVDASVGVTCSPKSGDTFPLGNTGVTCSTQDAAGNVNSVSFTVSVVDTTAPALLVPSSITAQATSSSGRIVLFSASATDAVTALPAVNCSPESGSTFPVGTTQVNCTAMDAAGNSSSGSFAVTVTPPASTVVAGHMFGIGDVGNGKDGMSFVFDVRESAHFERGWVTLTIGTGWRRNYFTSSRIDEVQFSNSDGYAPGAWPRSGIDTVAFKGTGCWNGRGGYRFEITATDQGEPGRLRDTFSLTVYSSTGAVVATFGGTLHNGNIQSLR